MRRGHKICAKQQQRHMIIFSSELLPSAGGGGGEKEGSRSQNTYDGAQKWGRETFISTSP
jgi:hypothetical protein